MGTISRRNFLRIGAGIGLGAALAGPLPRLLAGEGPKGARAKAVIMLWMAGGPSHIDTFDPKPGRQTGGAFTPIQTAMRGVKIGEHLPRVARMAKRLTIVRSMTSREADHQRATYLLHTGHIPSETATHPACGCVLSRSMPAGELPSFVSIGESYADPGHLGSGHSPLQLPNLEDDDPGNAFGLPEHVRRPRFKGRLGLLGSMDRRFAEASDPAQAKQAVALRERATRLLGERAVEAFSLESEPETVRASYGDSPFGRGCLLARRLVERGVRFVEVVLDGWDTHENNFGAVEGLCNQLDPAWAQLMEDLAGRKLLDETMVVWAGEFGRTPEINRDNGRDHHSDAFSVVLAGGGLGKGRVIGRTDPDGRSVVERPVTVPDLLATLYGQLGVDPATEYSTPAGRPIKVLDTGKVIRELLD